MVDFVVIIPARLTSTRLPGKVLYDLAGKTMLQRVYEQAMKSGSTRVIIATDNRDIEATARSFDAEVCMTDECHSGTDRIAEAIIKLKIPADTIIVNVQADEPFISPIDITAVAENLYATGADKATLWQPIKNEVKLLNSNVVKVITDEDGFAIDFSRAPLSDGSVETNHHHLGLYAYRAETVLNYHTWPVGDRESEEKLEQLRLLERGGKIHVHQSHNPVAVDINTHEDYEEACRLLTIEPEDELAMTSSPTLKGF